MRLSELLDMSVVQRLAEANHAASGMPIGIIDAEDGSVLVGCGWQEICLGFHRACPASALRCQESDSFIKSHLSETEAAEYTCKNGLRDIGVPIVVAGQHLATLFLGQFFYEGETPDLSFFVEQARHFGYDEQAYLRALDKVPTFPRLLVQNIIAYDRALARFIAELAEGALRHLDDERALRAADQRKDEFLAMLSHELRTPLAAMRNSIYVLNRAPPSEGERVRRAAEVIERQVNQLQRLVDDLLDVTRIARGKIGTRKERVDLVAVARCAADDHRGLLGDRGLEFAVELPNGGIWADADPVRVTQVIGNLLHNAAKFTPAGGAITLTISALAGCAEIRVSDTGVGIEREHLERIFDPFVQVDRTLARSHGGLGLGLALVKGIAELHQGQVEAHSAGVAKGATFTVRLPTAAVGAAPPELAADS